MSNKRKISKNDLNEVRKLDLLSYFLNYNPDELIRNGRNDYTTKTHSSLHMSNGLWCYWSDTKGGYSALDYFIKVENWEFLDAALYLNSLIKDKKPVMKISHSNKNIPFRLPNRNENNARVIEYLTKERCIDKEIVDYCIRNNLLYECQKDHSVIFVGYDHRNYPRYAAKRSTNSSFKMDIAGSKKTNSFNIINDKSKKLFVFESAIDLLSYLTLVKNSGKEYLNDNYLSIAGASTIGKKIEETTIPIALKTFLDYNKNIQEIFLCLDNDKAGKDTTNKIIYHLNDKYKMYVRSPIKCKDINELLVKRFHSNKHIRER